MPSYSIPELIKCAQREIALRKRVYARQVQQDKMDPQIAQTEIDMMEAIRANLQAQQDQLNLQL